MIGTLFDFLGGWKEVRTSAGFSYQQSRKGKRRIIPIEGYRKRGLADQQWIDTGSFADDRLFERFGKFTHIAPTKTKPKRQRLAKVDFALNR